jgi:hypothetical protein
MPTQLQLRGGTTTQNASFTGLAREVTVDTTKHTLIVHDGSTVGGHELALADLSNVSGSLGATYGISAETATGGVNLRLTGSNATTDDVKLAAGTNVTLTRTDANTITIAASGGSGATYGISAETATGGVNLRLTGSDSSTDDVKLAAGSNITLTRTDANTITIAAAGGGAGSGTVNSGAANKLAYYPSAGTTVDDISAIEWNSGTTTLTVTGTVAADNFVAGGAGTPNLTSDTDLEIITNASATDKTFTFTLAGDLEFAQNGGLLFQGAGASQVTALGSLEIGAGAAGIELISVGGAVTLSPTTQVTVDGNMVINSGYQLKFNTTPIRVVPAPTSSVGATGDKAGDVAFNGTSIFYCTADYSGTSYPSTIVTSYSGAYPTIVKGTIPQPQAGWQFIYNSVIYVLAANAVENNPGEWTCELTGTITVTAGQPVTVGPAPVTDIWVKSAWTTTGSW